MILYLDTSALVKLYVSEKGSDETLQLAREASQLVCHEIGYVEARAAFASAKRGQRLSPESHATITLQFRDDWERVSAPRCPACSWFSRLKKAGADLEQHGRIGRAGMDTHTLL